MLSLSQRQTLSQRLSPQQVQYLKMLQLPIIALEQRIKQEIEINPMLEELSETIQEAEAETDLDQEQPNPFAERSTDSGEAEGGVPDGGAPEQPTKQEEMNSLDYNWDEMISEEYEGYKAPTFTGPDNEEQEEIPQRAEQSLSDQLLSQLRVQLMSEDELALAEEIIGNIDDDGYLRRDLGEIVEDLNKFLSATRRKAAERASGSEHQLGDGHFDAYEELVADEPFGRERLLSHILQEDEDELIDRPRKREDDEDLPIDPFSVSFDDDDLDFGSTRTAPAPPTARPVQTVDAAIAEPRTKALSLEEMSRLSIEDLAKLLEQGTSAFAPPAAAGIPMPVTLDGIATEPMIVEENAEVEITFTVEEAERVLQRIQRLDPPGIGARDLRECLSIQLELEKEKSPAHALALRVMQETYTEFTMKHFEKICHRIGCTTDELKDAIEVVRTLNPKPGEGSTSIVDDNYLTPDFIIERDGDDFMIIPNDRHIPSLRISRAYQELMRRGNAKRNGIDRDTRKFLREKFEAAKWFIASIQQRRQTMMKVMRAIVDLQMDFFLNGPNQIRPMIYKDVAERIGMDISTVCRVVNGKYTQTDYGTFELRYFFSEKLETTSGEEVSTKIVKSRILEMIEAEDKGHPLSDDAISKTMQKAGFNVARRTVAKYREQMNIPVARLRRAL
jgi:RNA polymerase sigma-54 factor